ncbi:MAG: group II intron reverse transcriptase/maturase [Deltaproteobacteria bacterium]|nr:group II intron reverse transcriptase/maturase [Deltaproteobacteria bacterium]
MKDRSRSQLIRTKLQGLAQQAKDYPESVFTTLVHHIDVEWLGEAYRRTNKQSAGGVDGVTAQGYGAKLEENLAGLHERLRNGRYQAPPVERVWLEKEDGRKRPIGKPTFEEKIVQRAVVMVLEAVYEQDFYDFSHGFRPGHSPHQALKQLREESRKQQISWIVDADVQGYFDEIPHDQLREMIKRRVNDGGIMRLIGKWLKAGVMEEGRVSYAGKGSPQGGVISPLLANIYLHYVLDEWYDQEVKPRLKGKSYLIRYADDFVIGCELESDAQRIMAVLPKRFGKYGLRIHPEKTKLVRFERPSQKEKKDDQNGTFDFLGFTHYWGRSRQGQWVIKRKTAHKRQRRSLKAIWHWCKTNRHRSVREQHQQLSLKLRGHYQYYGLRGNYRQLAQVYEAVKRSWFYWLRRRNRKPRLKGERFGDILRVLPLPTPRIIHAI